jgi:sugar phosphate isomerase/epimerase
VDQSIRFFDWASQWCNDNAPQVRPMAELQIRANPDEDIQRIGDGYDELLEIVEQSDVPATWDFGHAFMNSMRFGDELFPSKAFLNRVGHVHCHDVSKTDHQPLVYRNVPWQHFLDKLLQAGFDGTVVLEVRPEEFLNAGGLDALIHSVSALHQHLLL